MNVSTMTRDQLRRLASEYNLPGRGSMRKAELVKAIEDFHNLDNAFIASGSVCALPNRAEIDKAFTPPSPPASPVLRGSSRIANRQRRLARLGRRASKMD